MPYTDLYSTMEYRFPLIAAVLEGRQRGTVLVNSAGRPRHFFVINKFGFCQEFFSAFDPHFFEQIKNYICSRDRPKLRLYAPRPPMEEFLHSTDFSAKAARTQFLFTGQAPAQDSAGSKFSIRDFTRADLRKTDFALDLANRYWDGEDDFLAHAFAVGAYDGGLPIGIWYAAGIGLGCAEMDAYVAEAYRGYGLGARLAARFVAKCLNACLSPSWDCYSNNGPSMWLAEKAGFLASLVYTFYNCESKKVPLENMKNAEKPDLARSLLSLSLSLSLIFYHNIYINRKILSADQIS